MAPRGAGKVFFLHALDSLFMYFDQLFPHSCIWKRESITGGFRPIRPLLRTIVGLLGQEEVNTRNLEDLLDYWKIDKDH